MILAKCAYYTFKLFGVATINVRTKPANGRAAAQLTSFASSKLGIAYNLLLIGFILALYYFALEVSLTRFLKIHLDQMIFDIHNISAGLTSIFILVYNCVRQGTTASIANEIKRIDDLVIKIHDKSHYEKIRRNLKIIFLVKSFIWIPIIATIDTTEMVVTLSYVYIQACNLTILSCILQYSVIINLLKHILGVINANFRSVAAMQSSKSHHNNSINVDDRPGSLIRFESIWQSRELYLSVCKVSEDLSQFYSPAMLLSLCHIFITLLFLSHCIIKPIILYGMNTLPIKLSLYCLFRMSQYIVSLIILTKMTTAAMTESKNSGWILNETLGNTRNLCVDPKVYHFSNYLLHRTLNFSVFGLFSLDESLIMSIIGSITTYLVICLQFQKSNSD